MKQPPRTPEAHSGPWAHPPRKPSRERFDWIAALLWLAIAALGWGIPAAVIADARALYARHRYGSLVPVTLPAALPERVQ